MRNQANSMLGSDGLPYVAWARTGHILAKTLLRTDAAIRNGLIPDAEFNERIIVFAPEGSRPNDPV